MENFPGTEEAWYRNLKERIIRVIDQIKEGTIELREIVKDISPKKILAVLEFILEILRVERKAVIEDILYSPKVVGENKIKNRSELERILQYIELILQAPREDFRLYEDIPAPIYGPLTIDYYSPMMVMGDREIDLGKGDKINFIDPLMNKLSFINCTADKVIATTFDLELLIEKNVPKKLNAILVGLGNPIPRAVRNLLRRLSLELNLPIYVLTEATPQGLLTSIELIKGPMEPPPQYLLKFSVPHALWVGVSIEDLPENVQIKFLNEVDKAILSKIKKHSIAKSDPYKRELQFFETKNIKAEIAQVEKMDVVKYLSTKIP
ncbi:MAG: hypothetical protein ACTSQY_03565 [Candidatus Odinarchaeia archaeon]